MHSCHALHKKHLTSKTHLKASEECERASALRGQLLPTGLGLLEAPQVVPSIIQINSLTHTGGATETRPVPGDDHFNEESDVFGNTFFYDGFYHDSIGNQIHFSAGSEYTPGAQQDEVLNDQLDDYGVIDAEGDGERFHCGVALDALIGEAASEQPEDNMDPTKNQC